MKQKILELIATDRLDIPLSSVEQRVRRVRKSLSQEVASDIGVVGFADERVYAYVAVEDKERARGMKEAIKEFEQEFPKHGRILRGKIEERRINSEEHLYFGLTEGSKLTSEDYVGVLTDLGMTQKGAHALYPALMDVSRKLSRARNEDRSVLVGSYK